MMGGKIVMAATGFFLACFLCVHLFVNASVYSGPAAINFCVGTLKRLGPFLWLLRALMLTMLSLHVFFGIRLTLENRRAKPGNYAVSRRLRSTFAAKSMVWTGLLIALFLFFHLLHFSLRASHPETPAGGTDVFGMLVPGFRDPAVFAFYALSLASLALHLGHGIQSMFQTAGLNSEGLEPLITRAGLVAAIVLFLGFISIPAAVIAGIVR